MAHTPHELREEFPEYADKIGELKQSDAEFAKLFDRYHTVNRDIHRAETDVEPVTEDYVEAMRIQRLALKDELFGMLKQN